MDLELLKKLEGLKTIDSICENLNISRQSAINLMSRLKKQGHVKSMGGGRRIRLYNITVTKQWPRSLGMFDMINRHARHKVLEWYDHQVHGKYTVEDAIIDAIEKRSYRLLRATVFSFNHVTDWPRLYRLANDKNLWQHVGALYDVARRITRGENTRSCRTDSDERRVPFLRGPSGDFMD